MLGNPDKKFSPMTSNNTEIILSLHYFDYTVMSPSCYKKKERNHIEHRLANITTYTNQQTHTNSIDHGTKKTSTAIY